MKENIPIEWVWIASGTMSSAVAALSWAKGAGLLLIVMTFCACGILSLLTLGLISSLMNDGRTNIRKDNNQFPTNLRSPK